MNVPNRISIFIKHFVIAGVLIVGLTQCTDESDLIAPSSTDVELEDGSIESNVVSISITGVYTVLSEDTDCSTCTFIVEAGTSVIDGKELGFGPGAVICLERSFKYGSVEFNNMEGSEEAPIIIKHVKK